MNKRGRKPSNPVILKKKPSNAFFIKDHFKTGYQSDARKLEIATVVAPYNATSNEQLSLQRGQRILVTKKTSTGWWQGEILGVSIL